MATATVIEHPALETGRPWRPAILWLATLGPFFFLSYGFANAVASRRAHVPSVVFGWEHTIPFLAWTIVPYWTSDVLYCVSLMVCTTRRELDIHAKRLAAAQLISVACFLAFPLRCAYERPETHGFFGWLFAVLLGFDKPFNQAPSLHVSLAVILWARFSAHLEGFWRTAMQGWLALIVVSTMTTYQHQFLDVPTGALAGLLSIAIFPEAEGERRSQRMRLAKFYLSGAALICAVAFKLAGIAWILLWPAAALLVVFFAYAVDWPGIFSVPLIRLIVAPYTAAAWINSRCWTRGQVGAQEIAGGVWLGRSPGRPGDFPSIVNVAAELPLRAHQVPMLDLVDPTAGQLEQAVAAVESCAAERPTLVCCALGYSRSAAVVVAWLVSTGRANDMAQAAAMITVRRPRIVLPRMVNHARGF